MNRRTLLSQLYPAYLFVAILSVAAMAYFITATCRAFFTQQVETDLAQLAGVISKRIPVGKLDACAEFGSSSDILMSIVRADGHLVCETKSVKDSSSLVMASAPIMENGELLGSIRVAVQRSHVDATVSDIRKQVLLAGVGVVALASIVTWLLASHVTRPLAEIRRGLKEFSQGRFSYRLPIADSLELAELAEAINDMASNLDERIRTIIQQRNEQEAVLSSMGEGVIAVDREERIIRMNSAAAEIFGVSIEQVTGKPVQEVMRNFQLHSFIEEILQQNTSVERDMSIRLPHERHLRLHGSVLRHADGTSLGVVVVIDDLTEIRRLEDMRRDFVANVSHELRTPITSMKGFVETLLDGALERKEDARRFVEIIGHHTERLREIIDNLMKLARLEQDGEKRELDREDVAVHDIFGVIGDLCSERARERSANLHFEAAPNLVIRANPPLVEQAVLNLVDNALKYTEKGKNVWISAIETEHDWFFRIKDEGVGIRKEHLDRIFERFYRVDKGRSRKEGGTGLGLAIVKHVALAHSGEVLVESEPGVGSIFTLRIPRPRTTKPAKHAAGGDLSAEIASVG